MMENSPAPLNESNPETVLNPEEAFIVYPPKYEKSDTGYNIWLRSFISLAAYLVLGYYVFPSYKILLLITAIVIIHEMGHFLAMKYFRYNDLGIFFIPLLGAYVSGSKREVSQKQSAIILLAGPLPGIIFGIILYFIDKAHPNQLFLDTPLPRIALLFIVLNLINLFPIYPLDGGQLLNRVFLDEEGWISKIFVFLSAGFMVWIAWSLYSYSKHPLYLALLLFPISMLLRLQTDSKFKNVEKRIEDEGINADVSYENLPDEDYWKIRNIIIAEHPSFREFNAGPPYEYSSKEDKMMSTIQSMLHRHLIQDISIVGKILIFLIWGAAITSPWLLNMDLSFFNRFGI